MNTPRKNYDDLQSPYAKHLSQYPSQSEEFLPFDLGGPATGNQGNRQTPQKNARYTSTPAKFDPYRGGRGGGGRVGDSAHKNTPSGNYYQNRHQHQHQHHRGRGNNRFYGISGAGRQSSSGGFDNAGVDGEKNYQRQPHRYNTQRGGRGGGGGGQQRYHNQNKDNGSGSYFHPSMLEDPWRELMQRHNAIRDSQINIQTPQEESEQQNAPVQQDKNDSSAESATSAAEQDKDEL